LLTVILEILDGPVFTGAVLFDGHQAFGICRHGYHPFRQAHAEGVVCTPDKEKAVLASNQPARQPTKQPKKKQTDTKKACGHATSEMQQLREDVFFSAVVVAVVAVG
jgi:hypothetical protein